MERHYFPVTDKVLLVARLLHDARTVEGKLRCDDRKGSCTIMVSLRHTWRHRQLVCEIRNPVGHKLAAKSLVRGSPS